MKEVLSCRHPLWACGFSLQTCWSRPLSGSSPCGAARQPSSETDPLSCCSSATAAGGPRPQSVLPQSFLLGEPQWPSPASKLAACLESVDGGVIYVGSVVKLSRVCPTSRPTRGSTPERGRSAVTAAASASPRRATSRSTSECTRARSRSPATSVERGSPGSAT